MTLAPKLILVTLEAEHCVWYLFHHRLGCGTIVRSHVAQWKSKHCRFVHELIEMCPPWGLEQECRLKVVQQEPREEAVFIFWSLNYSKGWKGKARFLATDQRQRSSLATYWVAHRRDRKIVELDLETGRLGRGSPWCSDLRNNQGSSMASVPASPDQNLDVSTTVTMTATSHICVAPSRPSFERSVILAQVTCPHCICQGRGEKSHLATLSSCSRKWDPISLQDAHAGRLIPK